MNLKRGSFTVEISLLLGIILFVIVTLVYIGGFIHNQVVLTSKGYEISLSGALEATKREHKVLEYVDEKIASIKKENFFFMSNIFADKEYLGDYVKLKLSASQQGRLYSFQGEINEEISCKVIKPVRYMWKQSSLVDRIGKEQ